MENEIKIGQTWVSEEGLKVVIVNITEFEIWYEIKAFSFAQPCLKEVFLSSMKLKK
ncbi:MAG: hypothetical protein WCI71_02250 [Bacteroidota bacterium]